MERLREYRVRLIGAQNAPALPISVLARNATIAIYQSAAIAIGYDATDFDMKPGRRRYHEQ